MTLIMGDNSSPSIVVDIVIQILPRLARRFPRHKYQQVHPSCLKKAAMSL